MASSQQAGEKGLQQTTPALRKALGRIGVNFRDESGPTQALANPGQNDSANIAGVATNDPKTINVMQPAKFAANAPQLVQHEGMHAWQESLPPAIQAQIPPDNPAAPYNYGGDAHIAQLAQQGKSILALPREQQAAAMQYYNSQGGDSNPKLAQTYGKLEKTIDAVPLSQIEPTAPNSPTLNTKPRTPGLPQGMYMAQKTYQKGDAAPGDIDLSAGVAQVQTGTVGGHAPDNSPVGVAQGTSNPPQDLDLSAGVNAPPQEKPYSTQLFEGIPGAAKQVGKGFLEGGVSDAANLTGNAKLKSLATPSGTDDEQAGQTFGKGVEQGLEFLIPGLGEEKAVSLVPDLKYAKPLARIGYSALTSGALNKAQGGGFGTGAAVGGAGGVVNEGLRAVAPTLAEKAIGIKGKFDRSFNKEPGRALLDETTGITPGGVAQQAKDKIADLSGQSRNLAQGAGNSTFVSLQPSRDVLSDAATQAERGNATGTLGDIQGMQRHFDTRINGQPIPSITSPEDALNLRQGFNQDHLRWNPDVHEPANAAAKRAYGALSGEIHSAVPGIAPLDERVSNLIPVANRAQTAALNDNMGAKILSRVGAHTGALSGALAGGFAGYQHTHTPEGAIIGGTLGAVVPEMISSPTGQLAAARLFNHPEPFTAPLGGAVLNTGRWLNGQKVDSSSPEQ